MHICTQTTGRTHLFAKLTSRYFSGLIISCLVTMQSMSNLFKFFFNFDSLKQYSNSHGSVRQFITFSLLCAVYQMLVFLSFRTDVLVNFSSSPSFIYMHFYFSLYEIFITHLLSQKEKKKLQLLFKRKKKTPIFTSTLHSLVPRSP